MRSSKRSDLDGVRSQFEAWRARPHSRAIPDHLWRTAVRLLDRYRSSAICRRLGLNPSRFKRMRETLGGSSLEQRGSLRRERQGLAPAAISRGRPRRSTSAERAEAGSRRRAFVELPPLGLAVRSALASPVLLDAGRPAGECRLVVDSAGGSRLTVVLARADAAVIDAVCRSVLHVPGQAGT